MTQRPELEGPITNALIGARRFFTKATVSDDNRTLHKMGGRQGDTFYRDRWSHDKVVRSTHGVNCTGSCSWKVYVKDGIITWESQQTDYPSRRPGSTRVRASGLSARCGVLLVHLLADAGAVSLHPRRAAGDVPRGQGPASAIRCWPGPTSSATRSRPSGTRPHAARAGWSGPSWDEAAEMFAAAHVHTIKTWGPDRVAGFSPIPAMSMVSHAAGARFTILIGGSMLSLLRLVRRSAGGLSPGLRRPDRRPGVRGLVGRRLPDHVGLQPPRHPHPRRALDDRGPLPRPEGHRGGPRLRRQRQVRRRVAARRARAPTARSRWRWGTWC